MKRTVIIQVPVNVIDEAALARSLPLIAKEAERMVNMVYGVASRERPLAEIAILEGFNGAVVSFQPTSGSMIADFSLIDSRAITAEIPAPLPATFTVQRTSYGVRGAGI